VGVIVLLFCLHVAPFSALLYFLSILTYLAAGLPDFSAQLSRAPLFVLFLQRKALCAIAVSEGSSKKGKSLS
jgi:hypothetical protein